MVICLWLPAQNSLTPEKWFLIIKINYPENLILILKIISLIPLIHLHLNQKRKFLLSSFFKSTCLCLHSTAFRHLLSTCYQLETMRCFVGGAGGGERKRGTKERRRGRSRSQAKRLPKEKNQTFTNALRNWIWRRSEAKASYCINLKSEVQLQIVIFSLFLEVF